MSAPYTLEEFVADLRRISASAPAINDILRRVKPLAQRLAAAPDLRARPNPQCHALQGFGFHALH